MAIPRVLAPQVNLLPPQDLRQTQGQFGPPPNVLSPQIQANSLFLLPSPLMAPEHSSKEVATHETFRPFFRLTR
jgi:hypothetical protein